jgi:hypothetical protein
MKITSFKAMLILASMLTVLASCEETETPVDPVNPVITECKLSKKSLHDHDDLFQEGYEYNYQAPGGNISEMIIKGEGDMVLFREVYEYEEAMQGLLLKKGSLFDAEGDLVSTLEYEHMEVVGNVLVKSKTLVPPPSSTDPVDYYYKEEYTYNSSGKKIKVEFFVPGELVADSILWDSTYNHNSNGIMASYQYHNYTDNTGDGRIYEFDSQNNLIKEQILDKNGNLVIQYRYHNHYGPGNYLERQDKIGENELIISYKLFDHNDYENSTHISHFTGGNDLVKMQKLTYNYANYLIEDYNYNNGSGKDYTWKYEYECE